MLGKLIKYELRSTARYYLPIYIAMVIVALLATLVGALSDGVGLVWFTSLTVYGLLAMSLVIITFVVMISRFYKNLLGAEGYLMFTLPVSTDCNILAKLIASVLWVLGSSLLFAATVLIFYATDGLFNGSAEAFSISLGSIALSDIGNLLYFLVLYAAAIASGILFCYLCMAIGQLFNEHKFLASVGAYLVLQTLMQILGIAGLFGVASLGERLDWEIMAAAPPEWTILLGLLAIILAIAAAEYFRTRWLLDKKLNLA